MVNKRLVFHFYVSDDYQTNIANKMHLYCLNKYSKIFNEALIVICIDDINEWEKIHEVEFFILNNIKVANITFKVEQNTLYREGYTFYNEIVKKMDQLEGLTFFIHNKGVTNVNDKTKDLKSILYWIYGMYYFNLEKVEEVEKRLIEYFNGMFYGSFLMTNNTWWNKYQLMYVGTAYWLNTSRIKRYCDNKGIQLPILEGRAYAESFPGELFEWNQGYYLCSYNNRLLYNADMYKDTLGCVEFIFNEDETLINEYKDNINKILENNE